MASAVYRLVSVCGEGDEAPDSRRALGFDRLISAADRPSVHVRARGAATDLDPWFLGCALQAEVQDVEMTAVPLGVGAGAGRESHQITVS